MRTRVQAGYVLLLAVLAGGIQCTAEGGGGEPCSRNLECIARSINTPICDSGKCRAGKDNDDCAKNAATTEAECTAQLVMSCPLTVVSGLWCDTKEGSRTQGSCGECIPDERCMGDPSCLSRYSCGSGAMQLGYGSFCDKDTLRCGQCVQDSNCPAMSFCLVSTLTQRKVCGECRTKTDCPVSKPYCLPSATTGANACVECDLDSQCSAPKKYCRPDGNGNKTCVECQADADCSGSKPRCGVSQPDGIKMCGECTSDAQCSASKPACDSKTLLCAACSPSFCAGKVASDGCRPDGTCGACSEHNQCASGVCYRPGDFAPPAAAAGLIPGQCVPSSMVKAVGTATIGQELSPGTTPFLKLSPGTYPALTINREVVLVGATPLVQNLSTMSQTILSHLTLMGGRTVLYDVRAEANVDGKAVIACSGAAKLNARLVRILNGRLHRGIDASGSCSEVLLSQAFIQADWEAMVLNPAAANLTYRVTNSQFIRSGSPGHVNAVVLGTMASGTFAYNTLYGNTQGVACANSQTISDSVITGTGTAVVGCTEQNMAKTTSLADFSEPSPGVFRPAAGIESMLVNLGQPLTPALTFDFFGSARPKGGTPDRGAEEIR